MAKNYYVILGISSRLASQEEIKAAYRKRAKELHPDRSGQSSADFLEIQEAYEVLGDPKRRREHDRQLSNERPAPTRPGSHRTHWSHPSHPKKPAPDWMKTPFDGMPSLGRAMPVEELSAQVILTRDQARQGGQTRVLIPLESFCGKCGGRGHIGLRICGACRGEGIRQDEIAVPVTYPVNTPNRYTVRMELERYQINGRLTVHFQVR